MRKLWESVVEAVYVPSNIESVSLAQLGTVITILIMVMAVPIAVAQGRSLLYVGLMLLAGVILVGFCIWCCIRTRDRFWQEWHQQHGGTSSE